MRVLGKAIFGLMLLSESALADKLAAALLEISVRASLEVTSRMTMEATTDETSPEWGCHRHHSGSAPRRYERCMRLDPEVAEQLLREAYAFQGPLLQDVADGLGVRPADLAAALVKRVPPQPTRTELSNVLRLANPELG